MKTLSISVQNKEIKLLRPEPIISEIEVVPYNKRMHPASAIDDLIAGYNVLVDDLYSSGLAVLNELKLYVKEKYSGKGYLQQRKAREVFQQLSSRLLLHIVDNKLTVKKSPEIGFLDILYKDLDEFLLPFPQVQGLNSAWQWYKKGIQIPELTNKIHPFYATYFPTRFEHIKLFDKWLRNYHGKKNIAVDIGVGSGVLSFQLLKYKFDKIIATDTNPNAIYGSSLAFKKQKVDSKVQLLYGDLFANMNDKADLIVFNPPWLPLKSDIQGIDKAMYYDDELFPRFFSEAKKFLKENGRIALIFSNLAVVTKVTKENPIAKELESENRFVLDKMNKAKVGKSSSKTRRNQMWRDEEYVELWILKHKK